MDMSKLSTGSKMALGGTIAFLVISIFKWQEIEILNVSGGVNMWHGWGVLGGLIALALLVWEGSKLMGINLQLPISPAMASAFLGIALAVVTLLKVLVDGEFRTIFAWLGLILAIVVAIGAVMNMQAGGESFDDMKGALAAGAAAASAAAKTAADDAKQAAESAKDRVEDAADRIEDRVDEAVDGDDDGDAADGEEKTRV